MIKAKILIIGQSPYEHKSYINYTYETLNIRCQFKKVAFIPKEKKNKSYNLKNITTYKRMLGVINNIQINDSNFDSFHNNIENKIKELANKGIFLVNQDELLKHNNLNKVTFINNDAKFICFGKVAYTSVLDRVRKSNHTNIYHYPHPSPQNSSEFWENYLEENRNYSEIDKLKTIIDSTLK
ncbi:hypothetical protein [Mammaliicoccus sciuri]|uniref:hypothetical protein n=1 Tax=Mammaliicoccus sciuri TaxID=1296 RepID=UPI000E67E5C5|nr:hypothetical protein [Mammaliicoccus sciuri]RIO12557.1 hypothetical protein BUZ93_11565 [Mammaliicoccus sciuri]RIO17046.1 hypothetical protein BUZ92_11615 [Mammaliicoccus sciuri]